MCIACILPSSGEAHTTISSVTTPHSHSVMLTIQSGSLHCSQGLPFCQEPKGPGQTAELGLPIVEVGPQECLGLALGITVISGIHVVFEISAH